MCDDHENEDYIVSLADWKNEDYLANLVNKICADGQTTLQVREFIKTRVNFDWFIRIPDPASYSSRYENQSFNDSQWVPANATYAYGSILRILECVVHGRESPTIEFCKVQSFMLFNHYLILSSDNTTAKNAVQLRLTIFAFLSNLVLLKSSTFYALLNHNMICFESDLVDDCHH